MVPTAAWQSGSGPGHEHHLYRRPDGCPMTRKCESGVLDLMTLGIAVVPPSVSAKGDYVAIRPIDRSPAELPVAMPWAVEEIRKQRERDDRAAIDPNEPPVPLTGDALERWQGRLTATTQGGSVDESKSIVLMGNDLAKAGMTAHGIDETLKAWAPSVGLSKFETRSDRDIRFAEIAASAVERYGAFEVVVSSGNAPRFLTLDELSTRNPPSWLLTDILATRSLALLVGDPGTYKTFQALSMALSIATGTEWQGHRVKAGPVAFIAGEGGSGLVDRSAAWSRHFGTDLPATLGVMDGAQSLADRNGVGRKLVEAAIEAFVEDTGPLSLVVVDTLARSFGGGNENAQEDMTRFVGSCDAIRVRFGCAVLIVHHNNRQGDYRGSSVLHGAVDTMIEASQIGGGVALRCSKQKDAEPFEPIRLAKQTVTLEELDEEGRPRSSLVFVPHEQATAQTGDGEFPTIDLSEVTDREQKALDVLILLGPGEELRSSDWQRRAGMERNKQGFAQTAKALVERGMVMRRPVSSVDVRYRVATAEDRS